MAANLQSRGLASLGKRLVGQIRSRDSVTINPPLSARSLYFQSVHVSAYDKNPEEDAQPNVVPDHVIPPQPEEYWGPHPKTGVFGPVSDENPGPGTNPIAGTESVLEQKAFFRPMEDLDKPPVQP